MTDQHHGGVGKYLVVFGLLCLLTVISFGVANSALMETKQVGWALMMAVSCGKALLVILFFMHLKWEANWKYVLTIPATIMSIFLLLMLVPDIGMRTRHYSEERWLNAAEPRAEHADGTTHVEHGEDSADGEDHNADLQHEKH